MKLSACTRVGLMNQGRLIMCDTPEQIIASTVGDLLSLRSSDICQARQIVRGVKGVIEVQTYGDQLRLFVDDASRVEDRVRQALGHAGVRLISMERARPRMEEAFISLIGQQRDEKAGQSDSMSYGGVSGRDSETGQCGSRSHEEHHR